MSVRLHRFDFGSLRDFRGPIVATAVKKTEITEPPPPPPPTFNEAELEAAKMAGRKQGFSEGFAAGSHETKQQADAVTADANAAISQLAGMVEAAAAQYRQILVNESAQLTRLVLSVARKVSSEAINERGEKEAIAIVERCLPVLFSKPKLAIELNPKLFDRALERIETSLRNGGFEGEVVFRADETLGMSDIRLDWGNGSVSRDADALWAEIETLIARVPLELTFDETLTTQQQTTGE